MTIRDTYTKVHEEWKDQPSEETAIFAADLEHIEQGIKEAKDNRALRTVYRDEGVILGLGSAEENCKNYFITGSGNEAKEFENIVCVGTNNKISGLNNTAFGNGNKVNGTSNIVSGQINDVSGMNNAVFGIHNMANEANSAAIGQNLIAVANQIVVGKFNQKDEQHNYVFIVGGGNSENDRKNIYTIDKEGNVVYAGDVKNGQGVSLDNLNERVEEVFQSVSDGKELIASAITDKGVETDATDTFASMAQNIGEIQTGGGEYEIYDGSYNLVPKVVEQSIETRDKVMQNNVTVAEIPFHEVSNETGTTVVIGGIV